MRHISRREDSSESDEDYGFMLEDPGSESDVTRIRREERREDDDDNDNDVVFRRERNNFSAPPSRRRESHFAPVSSTRRSREVEDRRYELSDSDRGQQQQQQQQRRRETDFYVRSNPHGHERSRSTRQELAREPPRRRREQTWETRDTAPPAKRHEERRMISRSSQHHLEDRRDTFSNPPPRRSQESSSRQPPQRRKAEYSDFSDDSTFSGDIPSNAPAFDAELSNEKAFLQSLRKSRRQLMETAQQLKLYIAQVDKVEEVQLLRSIVTYWIIYHRTPSLLRLCFDEQEKVNLKNIQEELKQGALLSDKAYKTQKLISRLLQYLKPIERDRAMMNAIRRGVLPRDEDSKTSDLIAYFVTIATGLFGPEALEPQEDAEIKNHFYQVVFNVPNSISFERLSDYECRKKLKANKIRVPSDASEGKALRNFINRLIERYIQEHNDWREEMDHLSCLDGIKEYDEEERTFIDHDGEGISLYEIENLYRQLKSIPDDDDLLDDDDDDDFFSNLMPQEVLSELQRYRTLKKPSPLVIARKIFSSSNITPKSTSGAIVIAGPSPIIQGGKVYNGHSPIIDRDFSLYTETGDVYIEIREIGLAMQEKYSLKQLHGEDAAIALKSADDMLPNECRQGTDIYQLCSMEQFSHLSDKNGKVDRRHRSDTIVPSPLDKHLHSIDRLKVLVSRYSQDELDRLRNETEGNEEEDEDYIREKEEERYSIEFYLQSGKALFRTGSEFVSSGWRIVPCTRTIEYASNDEPYRRLFLLVRAKGSSRSHINDIISSIAQLHGGVEESGAVLRACFNYLERYEEVFHGQDYSNLLEAIDESIMSLLKHNVSRRMFNAFERYGMGTAIREYVARELAQQDETKSFLLDLLFGDQNIAVVSSESTLPVIQEYVDQLGYKIEHISVESANIESTLRSLRHLKARTSLRLIFLKLTNTLSATEFAMLVTTLNGGNLRMVLPGTHLVLRSLQMSGHSTSCLVDAKIKQHNSNNVEIMRYSDIYDLCVTGSFSVDVNGALLDLPLSNRLQIYNDDFDNDVQRGRRSVEQRMLEWHRTAPMNDDSETDATALLNAALLVPASKSHFAKEIMHSTTFLICPCGMLPVENYFNQPEIRGRILSRFDPVAMSSGTVQDWLKDAFAPKIESKAHASSAEEQEDQTHAHIVLVLNVHLLSQRDKLSIISQAYNSQKAMHVILATNIWDVSDSRLKITFQRDNSDISVEPAVVMALPSDDDLQSLEEGKAIDCKRHFRMMLQMIRLVLPQSHFRIIIQTLHRDEFSNIRVRDGNAFFDRFASLLEQQAFADMDHKSAQVYLSNLRDFFVYSARLIDNTEINEQDGPFGSPLHAMKNLAKICYSALCCSDRLKNLSESDVNDEDIQYHHHQFSGDRDTIAHIWPAAEKQSFSDTMSDFSITQQQSSHYLLSFEQFIQEIPAAAWLDQKLRIEAWYHCVLSKYVRDEIGKFEAEAHEKFLQSRGNDVQFPSPLSYFISRTTIPSMGDHVCFLRYSNTLMTPKQMIFNQIMNKEEIDYSLLGYQPLLIDSFETLSRILNIYPPSYSLKLLATLEPTSIYFMLSKAVADRYIPSMLCLSRLLCSSSLYSIIKVARGQLGKSTIALPDDDWQSIVANGHSSDEIDNSVVSQDDSTRKISLEKHMAVMKWALISSSMLTKLTDERLLGEADDLLDDGGVPVSSLSSSEYAIIVQLSIPIENLKSTAGDIIPQVARVDGPLSAITSEPELRSHLLNSADQEMILCWRGISENNSEKQADYKPLGAVVVSAILNPAFQEDAYTEKIRDTLMYNEFSTTICSLMQSPHLPYDLSKDPAHRLRSLNPEELRALQSLRSAEAFLQSMEKLLSDTPVGKLDSVFTANAVRLTPAAFGVLVTICVNIEQVLVIVFIILRMFVMRKFSDTRKSRFFLAIAHFLSDNNCRMREEFLDLSVSKKACPLSIDNDHLSQSVSTIADEHFRLILLSILQGNISREREQQLAVIGKPIPVERSSILRLALMNLFQDSTFDDDNYRSRVCMAITLMSSEGMRSVLDELRSPTSQQKKNNDTPSDTDDQDDVPQFKWLSTIAWACSPTEPYEPQDAESCEIVLRVISVPELDFENVVSKNIAGSSALALFLKYPNNLSTSQFNVFARTFSKLDRSSPNDVVPIEIKEHIVITQQDQNVEWPPYLSRVCSRPITQVLRDDLIAKMEAFNVRVNLERICKEIRFDVSHGISTTTLRLNAQSLRDVHEGNIMGGTKWYICNMLLCWFTAAGFSLENVAQWSGIPIGTLQGSYEAKPENKRFTKVTFYPLPFIFDIRYEENRDTSLLLFGASPNDVFYTRSALDTVVAAIREANGASNKTATQIVEDVINNELRIPPFSDLLHVKVLENVTTYAATDRYRNLPLSISRGVGKVAAEHTMHYILPNSMETKNQNLECDITNLQLVIAAFFDIVRKMIDTEIYSLFSDNIIAGGDSSSADSKVMARQMFQTLIQEFKSHIEFEKKVPKGRQECFTILFRACFSVIGIHPADITCANMHKMLHEVFSDRFKTICYCRNSIREMWYVIDGIEQKTKEPLGLLRYADLDSPNNKYPRPEDVKGNIAIDPQRGTVRYLRRCDIEENGLPVKESLAWWNSLSPNPEHQQKHCRLAKYETQGRVKSEKSTTSAFEFSKNEKYKRIILPAESGNQATTSAQHEKFALHSLHIENTHAHGHELEFMCVDARPITRVNIHANFVAIELVPSNVIQLVDYSRDEYFRTRACVARMARFEPVGQNLYQPEYTRKGVKRMLSTFSTSEECWRLLESARDGVSILLDGIVLHRQNGQFIIYTSPNDFGRFNDDISMNSVAWPAVLLDSQHILKLNIDGEFENKLISDTLLWILKRGFDAYNVIAGRINGEDFDGQCSSLASAKLEPASLLTWYRRLDHIAARQGDSSISTVYQTLCNLQSSFSRVLADIMHAKTVNLSEMIAEHFDYDDTSAVSIGMRDRSMLLQEVNGCLKNFFATDAVEDLYNVLKEPFKIHEAFSKEFLEKSARIIDCGGRLVDIVESSMVESSAESFLAWDMLDSCPELVKFSHLRLSEERNKANIGNRSSRAISEGVESYFGIVPDNVLFLPTRSPTLPRIYVKYSEMKGMPLGYIFDTKLLSKCISENSLAPFDAHLLIENMKQQTDSIAGTSQEEAIRRAGKTLQWLRTVFVSPLTLPVVETICSLLFSYEINIYTVREELQNDPNLQVVLHRLKSVCPIESVKGSIGQNATQFFQNAKNRELVEDRSGYNVHRVWRSSMRDYVAELSQIGRVKVIDLSDRVAANTLDDNDLYLSIIDAFYDGHTFVYIRGLRYGISDKCLKLLAEWTKDCPWCGVYLEDVPLEDNLPENIDRVVKHAASSRGEAAGGEAFLSSERSNIYKMHFLPNGETHVDMLNRNDQISSDDQQVICEQFLPIYLGQSAKDINTDWEGRWRAKVTESLSLEKIRDNDVLHIEGPPGVGKTYLMTDLMNSNHLKNNHVIVDCSSDVLVIRPMVEYLSSRVSLHERVSSSGGGNYFVIFADEYHMLNTEQKAQLIGFARAKGCILIMVSNRLDVTDRQIMGNVMELDETSVRERIIRCRGMLNSLLFTYVLKPVLSAVREKLDQHIRSLLDRELDAIEDNAFDNHMLPVFNKHATLDEKKRFCFFHIWFSVMRQLFGEESMTHRIVDLSLKPLLMGNNNIIVAPQQQRDRMASLITEKNPGIPHSFCSELCKVIIEIFLQDCANLERTNAEVESVMRKHRETAFMHELLLRGGISDAKNQLASLLVRTALLGDVYSQSFPEFSIHAAKNSHRFHIVRKLVSYVQYMHERAGLHFTAEELRECGNLFLRFRILDKPTRFPSIIFDSGVQMHARDMCEVEVVCNYVDLSDLEAMRGIYVRGQAVNLDSAAEYWESHPITDYNGFMDLVPLFPPILNAVSDDNLFALLMTNESDPTLAQFVLHQRSLSLSKNSEYTEGGREQTRDSFSDPKNAYYFAAWQLYKHQSVVQDGQSHHRFSKLRNDDNVLDFQAPVFNTSISVNKLTLLRWVGRYASNAMRLPMKRTSTVNEEAYRMQFIEAMLQDMVDLTNALVKKYNLLVSTAAASSEEEKRILKELLELWSRHFAPLTRVGNKYGGLPLDEAMLLARCQYPPHPEWPPIMRILSTVHFTQLKSEEMRMLYEFDESTENEFWAVVTEYQRTHQGKEVLKHLCTSPLSLEWQRKIIETENLELPDIVVKSHNIQAFVPYLRQRSSRESSDVSADFQQIIKVKKSSSFFRMLEATLKRLVGL